MKTEFMEQEKDFPFLRVLTMHLNFKFNDFLGQLEVNFDLICERDNISYFFLHESLVTQPLS